MSGSTAIASILAELLKRSEVGRTGIYILLGDDPDTPGGQMAYIGEADDVGQRLRQHAKPESSGGKDFSNRAVALTSKDTNLTKAHARFLESRLIALAGQAGRARRVNATSPPTVNLPEADVSDIEYFTSQARIILPVLGVNLFRGTSQVKAPGEDMVVPSCPALEMRLRKAGIHTTAQEVDGEFTVRAGSSARASWVGVQGGYQHLFEQLVMDGTIAVDSDGACSKFTRDDVFASPSATAGVISGRHANGRIVWHLVDTGDTYADWRARSIGG